MNPIELGKFIANLRNEKKLTQEELAEKLYIDKRKISRWECGTSIPDFDMLIKLSEILDVTLYELSICKRIKNNSLTKKMINKFKGIKDFKKYQLKKKLMIFLAIIIGIFFGLTTIYTIDNYNTVEIYELRSLDENYYIEGNYIKTKKYETFNINKVSSINSFTKQKDIILEIFHKNNRITQSMIPEDIDKNTDYLYNNQNIISCKEKLDFSVQETNRLTLYGTNLENNKRNIIFSFDFELIKKYDNKSL